MPTSPTAPSSVPDFPAIGDATYNTKAYNWATHMDAVFPGEMQALATNAYNNAVEADTDATTATTQAGIATAKAVLTAADAIATAADRVQTGLDRAAADASAVAASKLNLGNKTSAPTLDNQGAALLAGATYYDTVLNKWRVWTGSAWGDGVSAVAGVSSVNGVAGAVTGIATTSDITAERTAAATLTNKTLTGYTETVYALSGTTPAFSEANGSIQTWTLSGASTPTDSMTTGQSITLVITPGAYSITWPSVTWTKQGGSGAAPTLYSAGKTTVILWKIGSTLYGSHLGDM